MKIEHSAASIVVLGSFRPDSFRPKTLADVKAISQKDASVAEMSALLAGKVVQFDLPWGGVFVDASRFQATTTEAPFIRICDLVVKTLCDLDTKYSITAFGINYEAHFNAGGFERRDQIGMKIGRPEIWGDWGKRILDSMKHDPKSRLHGGLMGMTFRLPFESGPVAGWRDVTVGPSEKVEGSCGILIRSNHHHVLTEAFHDESSSPASPSKEDNHGILLKALAEGFDASTREADQIFQELVTK